MTITDHLSSVPPFVCRLLANKTNKEIARLSGISLRTVIRICQRSTWAGVKIGTADKLLAACGIDPFRNIHRFRYNIKRIIKSKYGLDGVKALRRSKKLPLWVKSAHARHLKQVRKVLEEG